MPPYSLCPFALVFGQPCPGCGMGRALWACCNGELTTAFALHPLGPVVFATVCVVGPAWLVRRTQLGARALNKLLPLTPSPTIRGWFWQALLALTLGVWVARFGGALGGPIAVHSPLLALFTEPTGR